MSRRTWAGLGIAAAAAALIIIMQVPHSTDTHTRKQASEPVIPSPKQEHLSKQSLMAQDIASTDHLTRLDAKQHLTSMLTKLAQAGPAQVSDYVRKLQQSHDHFTMIIWQDAKKGKRQEYTITKSNWNAADRKILKGYLDQAEKSIGKQRSYESTSFKMDGKEYFVIAEPSKQTPKQGVIALMNQRILTEVANHQKKNLRLIPYPKEGKYKVESVHADTLRDITVRTGHDNEKASHFYENEIVVRFRQDPSRQDLNRMISELRAESSRKLGYAYVFHASGMDYSQLKSYFMKNWNPQYVEPHYLYMTNDKVKESTSSLPNVPNDLLFAKYQWNLPAIETNQGWDLSRGSNDVIVGIVDTGVDIGHPDLQGQLLTGYNVINPDSDPLDDVGHGTHVSGIIGALVNNNEGVAGISWYNKMLPVKALDKSGSGTTYSVAEGIIWAADNGAKVINMSLGNYADSQFLHDAVKYAYDRDVVLVAASGNDNTERPGYPAAYSEVLAVAATDSNMKRASYSNYGDYIDVAAPGTSIASTYPGNQYAALSGTSMASPHVAAMAALIRSRNPDLTNKQVMDIMRSSTVDLGPKGRDKYYGYGQIDIYKALQAAGTTEAPLQFWPQHVQKKMDSVIQKNK
ncbi:S8 family peptidase [Paenibacillus dokdonensis]|uniref:S8 family peptidase n=1 Tax=Paenibacillus dokdonensis TaxID=2567944 RepID=A0ABU6GUW4_9BACL|nr:S8 family peptidase [Paenibacillus dokdonensis]MEC0243023.1 S8 family peptidase [Paenibacillus dokdonensis]